MPFNADRTAPAVIKDLGNILDPSNDVYMEAATDDRLPQPPYRTEVMGKTIVVKLDAEEEVWSKGIIVATEVELVEEISSNAYPRAETLVSRHRVVFSGIQKTIWLDLDDLCLKRNLKWLVNSKQKPARQRRLR